MNTSERLRDLVAEMKRYGFTQLRKTTHGWLYGFKEFRFHLPNSLTQGGTIDQVEDRWREWEKMKSTVVGEYPGLKLSVLRKGGPQGESPKVVEAMQPVANIEDVLEGPRSGPSSVQAASEGSTPSPSAKPSDQYAGIPHVTIAPVPETAISQPAEQAKGEQTVAKAKQKRVHTPVDCPKCGRTFAHGGALGKHLAGSKCPGKPTAAMVAASNGTPRKSSKPVVIKAGSYDELAKNFMMAAEGLMQGFKALVVERDMYKKDRDELAEWRENISKMFAGHKK